jgi:hypothetical protein
MERCVVAMRRHRAGNDVEVFLQSAVRIRPFGGWRAHHVAVMGSDIVQRRRLGPALQAMHHGIGCELPHVGIEFGVPSGLQIGCVQPAVGDEQLAVQPLSRDARLRVEH